MSVCRWLGFCSARSSASRWSLTHVAEEQRQHVGGRQRRIGFERRLQAVGRAGRAHGDAVRLIRHPDARLGLDVEERLDPRRVGEIDRPARHLVAPPFEDELAAFDLGVPEEHGPVVGAAQLQIGAGHHLLNEVVADPQRRGDENLEIESQRVGRGPARRRRPRHLRRSTTAGAKSKMPPGVSIGLVQTALFTVTVPPSVGALKLPCTDRSASTTDRTPSGYRRCMSWPRAVTFSSPGTYPSKPMRPPNCTRPRPSSPPRRRAGCRARRSGSCR